MSRPSLAMLALLVLNLGASGFTTFKLITVSPKEPAPETPTLEVTGPLERLEPFVVNLDEPVARYLRTTLTLELESHDAVDAVEHSLHPLRDMILAYLSGLHVADTLGTRGRDKLRGELIAKIEHLIGPHQVRRIFFTEFVIQ